MPQMCWVWFGGQRLYRQVELLRQEMYLGCSNIPCAVTKSQSELDLA